MSLSNPFTPANMKNKWSKLWNKRSVTITEYDPTYKVTYLGNVITQYAKGDGCVDKPLATLWKNYCANVKHEITMKLTISNSGLKATTKEHGLTEYWANRITFCAAPPQYPKVFCWIYRHEGRRMKQELRCHAVLCDKEDKAKTMANQLNQRLTLALQEFRREKLSRQKARLSLANSCYDNPTIPRRKLLLSTGSTNFRPPLERSKSAPKLTAIDEIEEEEEPLGLVDDDEFDDEFLTGSVISEIESSSDIVPDDVDSLSDHYLIHGQETDSFDSDCMDDIPNPRRKKSSLKLIDETVDEEDNVSDESGYSEEKLSYKDDSIASYKM
ncbi:protein FAM43A [Trichonephila clavipes]|uniref:Protein FAM43A n=2 Tax=Trichonephila TaxID=2585208 RepID=A0A8X6G206_TRICU|nr:protein FAM43A [Trichonephila clavata]GFS84054.1 protein FAM43A [Trichonephila clavipes]